MVSGSGDLIKLIWHDGQGMCLFAKRLERGPVHLAGDHWRGRDDQRRPARLSAGRH